MAKKINYEIKENFHGRAGCLTPCPYGNTGSDDDKEVVMVASTTCSKCNFFVKANCRKQYVVCRYKGGKGE